MVAACDASKLLMMKGSNIMLIETSDSSAQPQSQITLTQSAHNPHDPSECSGTAYRDSKLLLKSGSFKEADIILERQFSSSFQIASRWSAGSNRMAPRGKRAQTVCCLVKSVKHRLKLYGSSWHAGLNRMPRKSVPSWCCGCGMKVNNRLGVDIPERRVPASGRPWCGCWLCFIWHQGDMENRYPYPASTTYNRPRCGRRWQ